MKPLLALAAVALGNLIGCPPPQPNVNPSINVTNPQPDVLIISGHGFNPGLASCAVLSMQGSDTHSVGMNSPTCSGGVFVDFVFPYSLAGCANPKRTTSVTIFAQDPSSSAGASQTIEIPWDDHCIVAAASCINSGAACVACGGEGQPVCSNGSCVEPTCTFDDQQGGKCVATQPDLHPTLSGSQLICTANCGHTQGYTPCYPYMDGCNVSPGYPSTIIAPQNTCVTASTGLRTFTCFDNSTILNNGSCACVPSAGKCAVNSSPGDGTCRSNPC
jgi:hypothetical protein